MTALELSLEERIRLEAIKLLQHGKPDRDIPHTIDSVNWMRALIKVEGGNERILVPTMYLHDTGYPELEKGYDFEDLMASKENHAERAVDYAKTILSNLGYTPQEIAEVAHLILYHDKHDEIKTKDQQLVFEADSLAQINWNVVTPNFDRKNCLQFLDYFKRQRAPKFRTQTGREFLQRVLAEAEQYWE